MRKALPAIVGSIIALLVLGAVSITGLRAQQSARNPNLPKVTTNWVGYLVVGQHDMTDQITRNPYPMVARQVEIGLRSDGVVIWREATQPK